MIQRGTPRKPGTTQKGEPRRMPYEAAEALLWGKRTVDEHYLLYGRMKELEDQHQAYDARIQATEAITEAAEAATSRIRHIEQQVAASESDEQDRPFDRWVKKEIDNFKTYVDNNKNIRQRQIELEKQISDVADDVDKRGDMPKLVKSLLRRIGRLEEERSKDANKVRQLEEERNKDVNKVRQLEKDVTRLTMLRQSHTSPTANSIARTNPVSLASFRAWVCC
jgi:DNA repair exonuclease SbcCD ATPase subunit